MSGETVMTIIGNLTADPEMRFLPSGVAVLKFVVASTPRSMDRDSNQWKDGEPLFMNCTAWRELAEHAAESLTKGARVIVTGRLKLSKWDDKETGEKRSAFSLDVDEVGPSLRFATATVQKMTRTKADGFTPHEIPGDEWASASPQRPAMAAA